MAGMKTLSCTHTDLYTGDVDYEAAYYHGLGSDGEPCDGYDFDYGSDFSDRDAEMDGAMQGGCQNRRQTYLIPCGYHPRGIRRRIKAVLTGSMNTTALSSSKDFDAVVAKHQGVQAKAGGFISCPKYDEKGFLLYNKRSVEEYLQQRNGVLKVVWWDKPDGARFKETSYVFEWVAEIKRWVQIEMLPKDRHQMIGLNEHYSDLFWVCMLFWKALGSTGYKLWDEELKSYCENPSLLDVPAGPIHKKKNRKKIPSDTRNGPVNSRNNSNGAGTSNSSQRPAGEKK